MPHLVNIYCVVICMIYNMHGCWYVPLIQILSTLKDIELLKDMLLAILEELLHSFSGMIGAIASVNYSR